MHRTSALGLVVLTSLLGIGCSTESADDSVVEPPVSGSGPTFYKDVYPIIQTRCASCHIEGGIAPFALTDPSAVVSAASATASAVQARTMPPWSPSELSVPLRDARTLSDQEIATFVAWEVVAMQFHYNVANGKGADRTKLELYFAPQGESVKRVRRIGLSSGQIAIPANASGVTVTKELEMGAPIPTGTGVALSDGYLVGALGHGHYLMTNHRMTLNPGTASERVLLDLDWSFHWQGSYLFQEPVAVHKGDVIKLDCTYDNTTEHRLAVGVDPMSTNVTFGETSEDEMCIGTFDMVTELP